MKSLMYGALPIDSKREQPSYLKRPHSMTGLDNRATIHELATITPELEDHIEYDCIVLLVLVRLELNYMSLGVTTKSQKF